MARHRRLSIVFFAALALGAVPALAADVTTPFAGKAVNGGTVTHAHCEPCCLVTVSTVC